MLQKYLQQTAVTGGFVRTKLGVSIARGMTKFLLWVECGLEKLLFATDSQATTLQS